MPLVYQLEELDVNPCMSWALVKFKISGGTQRYSSGIIANRKHSQYRYDTIQIKF